MRENVKKRLMHLQNASDCVIRSLFLVMSVIRTGRKRSSAVWDHFSLPYQDETKRMKLVDCLICKQKLSYCNTTANLQQHLRRHPTVK